MWRLGKVDAGRGGVFGAIYRYYHLFGSLESCFFREVVGLEQFESFFSLLFNSLYIFIYLEKTRKTVLLRHSSSRRRKSQGQLVHQEAFVSRGIKVTASTQFRKAVFIEPHASLGLERLVFQPLHKS